MTSARPARFTAAHRHENSLNSSLSLNFYQTDAQRSTHGPCLSDTGINSQGLASQRSLVLLKRWAQTTVMMTMMTVIVSTTMIQAMGTMIQQMVAQKDDGGHGHEDDSAHNDHVDRKSSHDWLGMGFAAKV